MKIARSLLFLLITTCLPFAPAEGRTLTYAELAGDSLTVAGIFTDHMVLQRNQPVNMWGTAGANSEIAVRFQSRDYKVQADASGVWRIQLPAMDAGGPYEMRVAGSNKTIRFHDVYLGDVWLASGQSNMAFRFKSAEDSDKETLREKVSHYNIRTYEVAKVVAGGKLLHEVNKPWEQARPSTVDYWSAVGLYFAKGLYEHLKVPIGIINCNQGGSRIEAWMRPEVLKKTGVSVRKFDGIFRYYKDPYVLYQGMLSQIIPYTIKGVIWYQGESNDDDPEAYEKLLSAMIQQWRMEWRQEKLPFLFAQLPGFERKADDSNEAWAKLRKAQEAVAKSEPNTAMVVLIDAGERDDIHPRNKKIPGERFVLAARAVAYGEAVDYSGPVPEKIRYKGKQAIISYDHAGGGLVARGSTLSAFDVLNKSGFWHPASAKLQGDRVTISSVDEIFGVRYGWANAPNVNLFNEKGLPAAPFSLEK